MPSPTYVALAKTVLTGSQATITFGSIPSTYTDLCLLVSARTDWASATYDYFYYRFNSDSGSNYSLTLLYGDGSAAASLRNTYTGNLAMADGATASANTFGNAEIYIPNYAGSVRKISSASTAQETNATTAYIGAYANNWNNTAAITTITLIPAAGLNWVSGSRFDLYGIKNS